MENSQDTIIPLQKGHISYLMGWLDAPVVNSQLRHRNEFLRMIKPLHQETEAERVEIMESHAVKDDEGNLMYDDEGQTKWKTPRSRELAQKEYETVLQEPITLVITKPKALEFVKGFLPKISRGKGADEGIAYEEICDVLGIEIPEEEPTDTKKSGIILP